MTDGATTTFQQPEPNRIHTISLFVHNRPGVLSRVALVFARRGYNIESLVVSPGAQAGFSRMTIACSGDSAILDQIIKQLDKLVDVVRAVDHTGGANYETEIALIKLRCEADERTEILQIAEHFNARVVDYAAASIMLRLYGSSEKLNAMIRLLDDYDMDELVRSGKILMARGIETT